MRPRRYFRCLVIERRFILWFGVVYIISMIAVMHKTSVIESDLNAEKFTNRKIIQKVNKALNPTTLPTFPGANIHHEDIKVTKSITVDVITKDLRTSLVPWKKESATIPAYHATDVKNSSFNCDDLERPTFLKAGLLPLTALHSFPGSGNTWFRVLISSMTGINTGDIYRDTAFAKTPGFSYRKDDTVIVVKTHHPFWDNFNGPDPQAPPQRYWERAVLIVRHPLDASISGFTNFHARPPHTGVAPISAFLTKNGKPNADWNKWAHDQIRNWGRCLEYWINVFKGPIVIVFYEDLKVNMEEQLIGVNQFLGLELNKQRLACTIQSNIQQKFHRMQRIDKRLLHDTSMLYEVEKVLENVKILISTNYTHIRPGFRIPPYYASNLVRENFAVKPNISM